VETKNKNKKELTPVHIIIYMPSIVSWNTLKGQYCGIKILASLSECHLTQVNDSTRMVSQFNYILLYITLL